MALSSIYLGSRYNPGVDIVPAQLQQYPDRVCFRPAWEEGWRSHRPRVTVTPREWDLWLAVAADPMRITEEQFVYGSVSLAQPRVSASGRPRTAPRPGPGLIKIGSSTNPLLRGHRFGDIVLIERGGSGRESELHRMFADLQEIQPPWVEGCTEWFRYEGALRAYVDG